MTARPERVTPGACSTCAVSACLVSCQELGFLPCLFEPQFEASSFFPSERACLSLPSSCKCLTSLHTVPYCSVV